MKTKKLKRRAITAWAQAAHLVLPCRHKTESGRGMGLPSHQQARATVGVGPQAVHRPSHDHPLALQHCNSAQRHPASSISQSGVGKPVFTRTASAPARGTAFSQHDYVRDTGPLPLHIAHLLSTSGVPNFVLDAVASELKDALLPSWHLLPTGVMVSQQCSAKDNFCVTGNCRPLSA